MTVTTVYAENDGIIQSSATNYNTARSGNNLSVNTFQLSTGQLRDGTTRYIFQGKMSFDTSFLVPADVISAAAIELYVYWDATPTDFTLEARQNDYGATLETGDYVAGASLSGLTLLASIGTSGIGIDAYKTLTESGSSLRDALNRDGYTRMLLCSSRTRVGNDPSGDEYLDIRPSSMSGTSQDPKITVTHEIPASGLGPLLAMQRNRLVRTH